MEGAIGAMHSGDDVRRVAVEILRVGTMPHCAAFGCNYQTKGKKNSDVSMHCFPSDKR